jgi:hypothetical protein
MSFKGNIIRLCYNLPVQIYNGFDCSQLSDAATLSVSGP